MYYPEDIIEEVRVRNDIVDVISQHVALKKKGGTYFGLCPFHNEKTPSFSVSREKQMFYCFGCGKGGNVFTFLKEYENYSFQEALTVLAERAGVTLPKEEESAEQKRESDLRAAILEVNRKAALYFYHQMKSERGKRAHDYFLKRGLSEETIVKFGLGYSNPFRDDLYRAMKAQGYSDGLLKETGLFTIDERGAFDKFWNRAMFPIMDANRRVIGFGGRVMGDGEPKYLNSPETKVFDKSRNLYGLYLARASRKDHLILCEGYMDVIALHQAGFDNAVASLGTALTPQHASLMKRYTGRVVISYDSDGAGQKAALRAIPILKGAGLSVRVLSMKPHKDPDEFIRALGREAYEKRIEEAENAFLFEVRCAREGKDLSDPEQLTAFHRAVARKLLEFPEELERNNYLEAACRTWSIPVQEMKNLVSRMAARGVRPEEPETAPRPPRPKKEKDTGAKTSQALLLTYLSEDPRVYALLKGKLTPEDFTGDTARRAAELLFAQLEAGEAKPAEIISHFAGDDDAEREAAALFQTHPRLEEEETDTAKVVQEAYVRVKKARLEEMSRSADISRLQEIMRQQKALASFRIRKEDLS